MTLRDRIEAALRRINADAYWLPSSPVDLLADRLAAELAADDPAAELASALEGIANAARTAGIDVDDADELAAAGDDLRDFDVPMELLPSIMAALAKHKSGA